MFSFMNSIYKEEEAAPPQDTSQNSMFGGMEVQAEEPVATAPSAFSFMAAEEAPTSAFTFIQETPADESPASGFTFLSTPADEPSEPASDTLLTSFSFMSGQQETAINTEVHAAPPAVSAVSFLMEPHVGVDAQKGDIKLAKTSLSKQVKKKKRASKVGFGREEDEDEEEGAASAAPVPAAAPRAPVPSIPEAAAPASIMLSAVNPISTIYVEESDAGYPAAALPGLGEFSGMAQHVPSSITNSAMERPAVEITLPTVAPPPVPLSPQVVQEQRAPAFFPASPSPIAVQQSAQQYSVTSPSSASPAPRPAPVAASPTPTPPAAAPVVAETAVQKLERKSRETLEQLVRGLADLSRLHGGALAGQDRFRREMDAENGRLLRARTRRDEAEQEQARLAQLEDFEGADALNAVVDQCGTEMRASEAALRDLTVSVRLLEQTFAQERADSINGLCRTAATLKATKEQLASSAAQMKSSAEKQSAVELARIAAELERIGLEKGHFEREESALSGDSERTEEAIRSQTGDLSERKAELQRAVGGVEEEIRILQEQLAAKLAERSSLSADLDQVEGRIGEVRKKYDRQLQRIADRQAALRQSKQECLDEEGAVLADQAALSAQSARDIEAAQQVREWAASLELDTAVLDAFLANLSAKAQSTGQIASISCLEAAGGDVTAEALRKNLEAILFLTSKKHAAVGELRANCDALLMESRRLGEQIPQLEAEKKAHAAAKRFKEAAAVAKDLKDVQSAKEGVDAEVAAAEASITHTLDEIDQLAAQQAAAEIQLAEAQRKRDVDRFETLLVRAAEVRDLQKLVRKHARKVSGGADITAAPVSGSVDSSAIAACRATPQAVQVFLAIELDAVLREAAVVKERYGLPQSLEEAAVDAGDSGDEGEREGDDAPAAVAAETDLPESVRTDGAAESAEDTSAAIQRADSQLESDAAQGNAEEGPGAEESRAPVELSAPAEPSSDLDAAEIGHQADAPEAAPAAPEFDRQATILLAKAAVAEVAELSQRMDEASDQEDYEQAAELFETITAVNERLQKALELLGCSADQLSTLDS